MLFLGLFILLRLRRGYVQLTSVLLAFTLAAIVTFTIAFYGGMGNVSVGGYAVAITVAGLLLGGRGAVVFFLLASLATLGVFYAETNHWITPMPTSHGISRWLVYVTVFGVMAALLRLASNSIHSALETSRQSNRELRGIRASLEERVAQRTQELQEINTQLAESYQTLHENQARLLISEKMASLCQQCGRTRRQFCAWH